MKLITSIICCAFLFSCSGKTSFPKTDENSSMASTKVEQTSANGPYLYIKEKNKCDFGMVDENKIDVIPIDIEIENSGNAPLVIHKADVSCGCVSVEYPKEPILPGKTVKLSIKVKTKDQKGHFNKAVFINSNAINDVELIRITGQIK